MPSAVAVYEAVDDGKDFIFTDFNPAAERIEKTTKASILGKPVTSVFPAVKEFGLFDVFQRVYKTGNPEHFPITIYKDDTRKGNWRENWVTKLPNGNIAAIYNDITEQKTTQEKLKASEQQFRLITNAVREAIVLVDDKGKIKFWNPAAKRIFGYSANEAKGKLLHELLIPNSTYKDVKQHITSAFTYFGKSGKGNLLKNHFEVTLDTKNAEKRHVELSISPIYLDEKWHAVSVIRDITEKKQHEQLTKKYAQKLEDTVKECTNELKTANENLLKLERWAAIGELAGMVGHDLRNPLAGIKNATYVLRKKQNNLGELGLSMLDTIDQAVEHADDIINDLLDYSRELHMQIEQYSSKVLVDYTLLSLQIPQDIKIKEKVQDYPVNVDVTKVQRVFINLIKNAIEAMPNGGEIEISSKKTGDFVEFLFQDTGSGMSEEVLSKIFTPLFTTKAQGMGLGLAICKRLVEANKGQITVQSTENKGTTFTVALPTAQTKTTQS